MCCNIEIINTIIKCRKSKKNNFNRNETKQKMKTLHIYIDNNKVKVDGRTGYKIYNLQQWV